VTAPVISPAVISPARHPAISASGRVVVAGAGVAGWSAAERLRERGHRGEIVVVGEETHRPYHRPPLSKQLLTGAMAPRDLALRGYPDPQVTWRRGTRVVGLDAANHTVVLPGGERLGFDGLIIATGVEARHLPGTPVHSPRVWMLRTLDDARAIDAAMARAGHVAVIGGGFLGCELACTARARGLQVTVIDISPTLLTRGLSTRLGQVVTDLHREAGVRLRLGVGVSGWREDRRGVCVELADGTEVRADVAVVGVGTHPRTDWLHGNGWDLTDGVLCAPSTHVLDGRGRALPRIVAAGDVARWPNLRFERTPRRVEHQINAIEMGQAAADALLTGPGRAGAFTPIPRFWSHQHGVRIQSVGMPQLGTQVQILHGSLASRRVVAGFTRPAADQTPLLVGVIGLDSPRTLLRYRDLLGLPLFAHRDRSGPAPFSAEQSRAS